MKEFNKKEKRFKKICEFLSVFIFIMFLSIIIFSSIFINLDKFIPEEEANKIWNSFYNFVYDKAFILSDENGKVTINSVEFPIIVNKLSKINYDENENKDIKDGVKIYMDNSLENFIEIKQLKTEDGYIFLDIKVNILKTSNDYIYNIYTTDNSQLKNYSSLIYEPEWDKSSGEYLGVIYIKNLELNKILCLSRNKLIEGTDFIDEYEEIIYTIPIE